MNLVHYQRSSLRSDIVAGVTTGTVVIPMAMAYATIAGVPVEVGLWTALVPAIAYALFGTSPTLSVTTTTTIAILTGTLLKSTGVDAAQIVVACGALTFLVGVILLLAGIFRLGFLANLISDPVLTGFKAGIGLVIIIDQIPKLLGVRVSGANVFAKSAAILEAIPQARLATVILGVATLATILLLERYMPRVPAPLVVVVGGVAASALLRLDQMGVALAGEIPRGLPVPHMPDLALVQRMWPGALGIALMSFTESIAVGRSMVRAGDPIPNADRELIALGVANLAAAPFRTLPSGGGTSQTVVNLRSGAKTQVSGLVTAGLVAATLLVLAPLIALLPQATLGAVVVATAAGMLSVASFASIARVRGTEFYWALIAFVGVALLGTLQGILVAVAVSLLVLLRQANHPRVYALRRDPASSTWQPVQDDMREGESLPGLLVVRAEGRMTFASAPRAEDHLLSLVRAANPTILLFDCSAIPDFEYTALRRFERLEVSLRAEGVTLWLASLNPEAHRVVERSPFGSALGRDRVFLTVDVAVAHHLSAASVATAASAQTPREVTR